LSELLGALENDYQSWSGFWDALRRSVTLPLGVRFDDFKSCPSCYKNVEFSPSALFDAVQTDVIDPLREVQKLIDRTPYTTRLYSTLSAAEMTVDPLFVFNPDLPEVNNIHRAERVIECSANVYESEAPWRIELPQGSLIRGTPRTVGQWPGALDVEPANLRVLTLSSSGTGRVLEDNSDEINTQLAAYNEGVRSSESAAADSGRGGFCSLGRSPGQSGPGQSGPAAPLWLALSACIGAAWARRLRA
jgi:hypothetical protein